MAASMRESFAPAELPNFIGTYRGFPLVTPGYSPRPLRGQEKEPAPEIGKRTRFLSRSELAVRGESP